MTRDKPKRSRLRLIFTVEESKQLETMVESDPNNNSGKRSKTITNALRLYEWALEKIEEGYQLGTIGKGSDGIYNLRLLEKF